jgi:hypothetical protein
MIDVANKVLFIHIPRTAGSGLCHEYYDQKLSDDISIERYNSVYLGAGGGKRRRHFRYQDYARIFPWDFKDFYKFTVIRNPWDLVVSYYWHGKLFQTQMGSRWSSRAIRGFSIRRQGRFRHANAYGKSFKHFVSYLSQHRTYLKKISLYEAIRGDKEDIDIIRYENYNDEIGPVFDRLEMTRTYERFTPEELEIGYSMNYLDDRPIDYREMYTSVTKDIIWNLYKKDIKEFNYEF